MHQSFRFEPTTLREHVVDRPRLTSALARRFEVRLTTVIAAAGFGKTTALAQARHGNELDPRGDDIWLGADEADADPTNLLDGLVRAAGGEASGVLADDIGTLCDLVWQRAPREVALIVDDAHLLGDDCAPVLQQLLDGLPANGHLVLAGRSIPDLALGRLRARHDVMAFTEDDLRLDDDERSRLARTRGGDEGLELSAHAASADLLLTAGREAITDYLREEVLAELDADRLQTLAAVSVLDEFDDALVAALAVDGCTASALALVRGLPMVETHLAGTCRLHALLRGALAVHLDDRARATALRAAADVELARNRLPQACQLFARAGAVEAAVAAARALAVMPTLRTRLDGIRTARRALADVVDGSALVALLDAQAEMNLPSERVVERWETVAQLARNEGDALIEAVALFRAIQAANQGRDPLPERFISEIERLAPDVDFAAGLLGHLRSWQAQGVGDAEVGIRHLDDLELLGPDLTIVMRAERLCDLGRPEEVGAGLGVEDLQRLPPGTEIFIGFAMWLRGEVPAEVALEIGNGMVAPTLARGWAHTNVSLLGVMTYIAAAAGDLDQAVRHARAAAHHAQAPGDVRTTLFVAVAEAAIAVMEGDEDRAAKILDPVATGVPLTAWPARPHLLCISLLHLLRPETRPTLDACDFGPSLAVALRSGQALVALRERGSAEDAAALPWDRIDLLRSHVLPPLLVELAIAASAHGVAEAGDALAVVPPSRAGLEQAAACADARTAALAAQHLAALPVIPTATVTVHALGPLELARDGVAVADKEWVRRGRVRELMGLLVEFGRISRDRAMAELWPDLEPDKATTNLRVTLSHLQRVLEPERSRDAQPACVLVSGDTLELSPHVRVDTDRFLDLADRADALDRAGAPGDALGLYRDAAALVRGSFLEGIHAPWTAATRTMIDSRVRTVVARLGELELARGEPEVGARHAATVLRLNELDERGARLMIVSLLASGDRAGAHDTAARIVTALADAGLEPELETRRVVDRVRRAAA